MTANSPSDSSAGSDKTAVVSAAEPSDDATRIISSKPPSLPLESNEDGATVIVANPLKKVLASSAASTLATQFPTTRPGKFTPQSNASEESSDANLLPMGTRVAEFEVTRIIGQGGFGVVYEAWDHTLERVVAIKEYMPTALANRRADGSVVPISQRHQETFDVGMRSFINEARLLAQFDHPSLLKVYRFWQERGTTYMVMPCYKGDTLKQALADTQTQVKQPWLLDIIDGVTQALAVMHRANCYHRDIAPDNIMLLESNGLPVVLDFGAARRVITNVTQAITVILKPGYAPIEQYSETPEMTQGAWTDVYALSAVMHVAVTGRSPPPSVARLLNDRYVPLAGDAVLLQRFSNQVLSGIDAGLGVRPESRPQSMAQFRLALGLPSLDEGVTLASSGRSPSVKNADAASKIVPTNMQAAEGTKTTGQKKSTKTVLVGAVVVTLLLAAGGVWWIQNTGPAGQIVGAGKPSGNATGTQGVTPAQVAPAATAPIAAPVAKSFSLSQSLNDLLLGVNPSYEVVAKPVKAEVLIGKDKLEFQVKSSKAGFVYVYYLSSNSEMYLLFPNALDKRNRIEAGATLSLPRPSWAMDAGGPAGVDEFVVLVSERERDIKATGIQYDGVFGQFPVKILAALEAGRGNGPPILLGTAPCEAVAPCADPYGAISFKITEK